MYETTKRAAAAGIRQGWCGLATGICAVLAWLVCGGVSAQTPGTPCGELRLRVDGELGAAWLAQVSALCEELSTMTNIDPAVEVSIRPEGSDVIVEASAADGRNAVRRVRATRDLSLKVKALMLVPATPAPAASEAGGSVAPAPASAAAAPTLPFGTTPLRSEAHSAAAARATSPRVATEPASAQPALGVEVGAVLLGRISRAPTYVSGGVGVHAGIRTSAWLLALALRWEPAQALLARAPRGFEMDSVGAGFLISRRVLLAGPVHVECGVSSFLIGEIQSLTVAKREQTDSEADVRIGLFARLLLGRSAWRWALSLETDVSPLRLRRDLRVDPALPKLPNWSFGAGLGGAWGES